MFRKIFATLSILATVQATNSFAQNSSLEQAFLQNTEARATLTIPFGSQSRSYKDKTRVEFGIRQYRNTPQNDWVLSSGSPQSFGLNHQGFIDSKFGFTLSDKTDFLLNGQAFEIETDEELGISTGGKIAIGVGVTLAIGLIGAALTVDAIEDGIEDSVEGN